MQKFVPPTAGEGQGFPAFVIAVQRAHGALRADWVACTNFARAARGFVWARARETLVLAGVDAGAMSQISLLFGTAYQRPSELFARPLRSRLLSCAQPIGLVKTYITYSYIYFLLTG